MDLAFASKNIPHVSNIYDSQLPQNIYSMRKQEICLNRFNTLARYASKYSMPKQYMCLGLVGNKK
jgi:hypothetical protein